MEQNYKENPANLVERIKGLKNIGKEKILLLGMAGIMLMGASYFESRNEDKETEQVATTPITQNNYQKEMEDRIRNLILSMSGISDVSVMVTLKSGGEKILKEDSDSSCEERIDGTQQEKNNAVKKSTVIFGQGGDESPYVIKELYPEVLGIAVTAKGIANESQKEEMIHMLSALFDIPVHKISIIEMK